LVSVLSPPTALALVMLLMARSHKKWFWVNPDGRAPSSKRRTVYVADKGDVGRFKGIPRHRQRVQCWAGITRFDGTTDLAITFGNMKSQDYLRVLRTCLELAFGKELRGEPGAPGAPLLFQQDNARIHTSKETMDGIKELGWHVFPWPALSPDFSPIEFIWARMASELDEYWRPQTVRQLHTALPEVWRHCTTPDVLDACSVKMMEILW